MLCVKTLVLVPLVDDLDLAPATLCRHFWGVDCRHRTKIHPQLSLCSTTLELLHSARKVDKVQHGYTFEQVSADVGSSWQLSS